MLSVAAKRRQGEFLLDVDFAAGAGVTALFGRSGSGKTSVVNMVAGLYRPDRGRIVVGERVLFDSGAGVDVAPERRRVGYVFQEARLFPHMSVRGNLEYGLRRVPRDQRYVDFGQVVSVLGVEHLLDRRPSRLSGGEKQRVAIGRALLASPKLLLMDEPLASLDAGRKAEVLPFIARLPREFDIPILYVSHSMEEILRLADTLVVIDKGRVAAAGPVETLLADIGLRPLTGRYEAGAVIRATVEDHDDGYGLTRLRFAGGTLGVGRIDLPPGQPVRLRIHARDIALALDAPDGTSIRNVFPVTITGMAQANGYLVDVALDAGGCPLWAQVTRQSADSLRLQPGRRVYALVKALAIARSDVADWDAG